MPAGAEGERLVDLLLARGMTPRQARSALRSGKVLLDGFPVADGGRRVLPSRVRVEPRAPRLRVGQDPVLLRRDGRLAVLHKPAALPVAGRGRAPSLRAWTRRLLGWSRIVVAPPARVAGLALVARDPDAARALAAEVDRGGVALGWCALVSGGLPAPRTLPLDPPVELEPVEHLDGATLVAFTRHTPSLVGLRRALAAAGLPPAGPPSAPWLCGRRIELRHPFTGRRLRLATPLSDGLARAVRERRASR